MLISGRYLSQLTTNTNICLCPLETSQYRVDEILGNSNYNLNMGVITSRFLKQKQTKMTSTKKPYLFKRKKYSKVTDFKFVNKTTLIADQVYPI